MNLVTDRPELSAIPRVYISELGPCDISEAEMKLATFNARAETVATKPIFRSAFTRNRFLIPVIGYSKWQDTRGGKQPWYSNSRIRLFLCGSESFIQCAAILFTIAFVFSVGAVRVFSGMVPSPTELLWKNTKSMRLFRRSLGQSRNASFAAPLRHRAQARQLHEPPFADAAPPAASSSPHSVLPR